MHTSFGTLDARGSSQASGEGVFVCWCCISGHLDVYDVAHAGLSPGFFGPPRRLAGVFRVIANVGGLVKYVDLEGESGAGKGA